MSQSASEGNLVKLVVAQPLHDDGDEIIADDRLTGTVCDAIGQPFALSALEEFADAVANRSIIERAVGMLMLVYDLEADNAFEVLTWGSLARNITIGVLARQMTEDLAGRARDLKGHAPCENADLRSACDDVLFVARERVAPFSLKGIKRPQFTAVWQRRGRSGHTSGP